jgi:hypothetical protein
MDQDPSTAGAPVSAEQQTRTPEQIEADIERTRAQLGDTAEALAAKTDVKARAQERVDEVKQTVRDKVGSAQEKAREATPSSAQQAGGQVVTQVKQNRTPLMIAGAALLVFLLGRRSGRP